jgi:hypothetical protein
MRRRSRCAGHPDRRAAGGREIAEEIGATKSAVRRMNQRIEREARKAEGGEEAGRRGRVGEAAALSPVPRV